ncbi:MAG: phosphoadenylyl-sulfate reductase [Burkholderiales bacterium]
MSASIVSASIGEGAISRNAKPSAGFAEKLETTKQLLTQAARGHAPANGSPNGRGHGDGDRAASSRITQASSLGAEDVVISHLIESLKLPIDVFVLDTGMLHTQTLALLAEWEARTRLEVRVFQPNAEAAISFVARHGKDAMYESIELRKSCCQIRKGEPLARALAGYDAWITGMRREQSGDRADVPMKDTSQATGGGRIKYNPLADWSWGDVWHYIATNNVPYNPLHDQFFPSIGCAPCTRAISMGEDFRAGRWWWENHEQKECGLHVAATPLNEGTPA